MWQKDMHGGNDKNDNAVDAISGATITGDGVTAMFQSVFNINSHYFS